MVKSAQDEHSVTPPAAAIPAPEAQPPPVERRPERTPPREIGGRDGPEPTRFGDWEKAGRCIDF